MSTMMKNHRTTAWLALAAMVVFSTMVFAHHGLAEFDQTKKVTLKGAVTVFRFVNPHSVVEFDVKDEAGHVQNWQGQLTSRTRLKGWTATSLEPGVTVTVIGYRAKSGAPYIWVTSLKASNGVEIGEAQAIP